MEVLNGQSADCGSQLKIQILFRMHWGRNLGKKFPLGKALLK